MKDRLKYVVDSRYFDGTCLTSMSDGFRNDYGGETIEELRTRENNPFLKVISATELDKMLRLYHQSLSEPFREITEEDYYDLLDVLPPLRMRQNSFFVGEPYYGSMYSFCFTREGRYFKGLRSIQTPQSELDRQIDRHMGVISRKAIISKEGKDGKTVKESFPIIFTGRETTPIHLQSCHPIRFRTSKGGHGHNPEESSQEQLPAIQRKRKVRNSGRTDRPCIRKETHPCFRRTFLPISSRQGIRNFHRTHQGDIRGISFPDL